MEREGLIRVSLGIALAVREFLSTLEFAVEAGATAVYMPHDVNGTRIIEQLRDRDTYLSTFMYYGNLFAGKLLEVKHLGKGTFTDVGTTYKMMPVKLLPPFSLS